MRNTVWQIEVSGWPKGFLWRDGKRIVWERHSGATEKLMTTIKTLSDAREHIANLCRVDPKELHLHRTTLKLQRGHGALRPMIT